MTIARIQVRRDTAANWTSANPTLASGEPGFETDTGKFKVGDGATAWASLSYFTSTDADVTDLIARWVAASASGPASLDFHEDTDNGANRVRVTAPSSLAADATVTLPANTGTLLHTGDLADVGTPASGDQLLLRDVSDSNKVKYAQASALTGVLPHTFPPGLATGTPDGFAAANRAYTYRVRDGHPAISKIGFEVTTANGNMSVAIHRGTARSRDFPTTLVATSAVAAVPAAGYQEFTLTSGPFEVLPGDWFSIACSSTTARFRTAQQLTALSDLAKGFCTFGDAGADTLMDASTFSGAGGAFVPAIILIGVP